MKLNLNRAPYYNDFDASKNDMAVLYRPGRAVQGRELNADRAITQHQIERFASHIFKNGSRVTGGRAAITQCEYVRLRALTPDTNEVLDVEQFAEGAVVVGEASGLRALIRITRNAENDDPATLFVVYTNTAIDGETTAFVPGENLTFIDSNGVAVYKATVRCPSCPGSSEGAEIWPTGRGHIFAIEEGSFYFEGMFLESARQQIIVSKYSYPRGQAAQPFAGKKVGFDFVQNIVTAEDDPSLYDPSLGYPNATAPGADRYRVELNVNVRSYDAEDGESFILLAKIDKNYTIQFMKSDSEYAEIMDMIAKRQYETNGDYTIRPFKLSFYEEKKATPDDPRGWTVDGSPENLIALVTPSTAYVRGYRVETIADTPIPVRKARDTAKFSSFIKRFDQRTNILLKPKTHVVWPGDKDAAGLVDKHTLIITDQVDGLGAQIGTARINDIEYVSGTGADNAVYRYTLSEIKFSASGKTLKDAKSFVNASSGFIGHTIPGADGVPEISQANNSAMVFRIERTNIKSLRDADNPLNGSLSINVRRKLKATLDSAGIATFNTLTNEFFESIDSKTICFVTSTANVTETKALNGTNSSVAPTAFTVNFGAAYAGQTVTVITTMLKTNQREKTKTLNTSTVTTTTWPGNTIGTTVFLGKADAVRIVKIEMFDHTDNANPVFVSDVTGNFRLDSGQTDYAYKESSVVMSTPVSGGVTGTSRLHITFTYFDHSGTEGFFTVDSYSQVINDPANNLTYADIPVFVAANGAKIPLIDAFDFRPIMLLDGTMNGVVPANDSTAIFDVEFYLPRTDIIQINKKGEIYVKYGAPAEKPTLPVPDADAMVLYQVFLQAYTYSTADVRTKFIENKRYTMRDIGRLEERIKNVEYYTTLNLLEKSAADMAIKDQNGLDRFKNGFIADNFADFQAADLPNLEFKAAMDRTRRELRPSFKAKNFALNPVAALCQNVQWRNKVAILPFVSELSSENPYATKHISVNPYFQYNAKGQMVLSPNMDTWSDETRLPDVVTNIDTGVDTIRQIADAAGLLGVDWGSWVDQNTTIIGTTSSQSVQSFTSRVSATGNSTTWETTTEVVQTTGVTTATEQARTGESTVLNSRVQSYTIEDIVKDVQIIPFVREATIEFYAARMRPNTRVYAFFDGVDVSEHCRDIGFSLSNENAASRTAMVEYGSPLYTNETGEIRGEFRIPGGQFFTGKSIFRLSNDGTQSGDPDMELTSAEATYFSGGLDVTKQDSTLNLSTPLLTEEQISESRTVTNTTWTVDRTVSNSTRVFVANRDPVAQQIFIEEDQMITGLDLYFQSIDRENGNIFVELRQMDNGYPAPGVLASREYDPSQLTFSEDSTVPFHVDFDVPVFLQGGRDYCFVVGGWTPNTRIWVAKLGGEVVDMPGKIVETQPTLGSSFRSQNNKTWNAEQFETIKYRIYRARFTETEMTVAFENDSKNTAFVPLQMNPIETESGSDKVRLYIDDHGLNVNDRVRLAMFDDAPILVKVQGLPPQIGQFLHTATGSGTITDIVSTGVTDQYRLSFSGMTGRFLKDQVYTADAKVKHLRDNLLITAIGGTGSGAIVVNEANGTFLEDSQSGAYLLGQVNGISVEELNKEHTVIAVDSIDSVIVQVTTPANASQRSGGAAIKAYNSNYRYETMNIAGSYLAHSAVETWTHRGILHGVSGGVFDGQDYANSREMIVTPGSDYQLDQPYKIASGDNETRVFGANGQKSVAVTAVFKTSNPLVSPVVDTATWSITAIANRVDWTTADSFNVEPNSAGRFVAETDPLKGTEVYKYVTRNVNLANPASDLMIYVDYYKDQNADFDIYVKKLPVYGDAKPDTYPWLKVNIESKKNSQNLDDFIELEARCSDLVDGWKDANDDDIQFITYKVKIVGKARNTARPPLFKNLRAIAVT